MNSSELSARSGVTVRALRHYHQVGVLPEPSRSRNGYRQYGVQDLIRVLRIKRLASLGISLERMPALLDSDGSTAHSELDRLDAELEKEIARLIAQRELVARLKDAQSALDVPPEIGAYLSASAAALTPTMARLDREQSVLLAHLVGEKGMPELARFYAELSDPRLLAVMSDLNRRFELCGVDGSDESIDLLVADFLLVLRPVSEKLASLELTIDVDAERDLFSEFASERLNDSQQRVLAMLAADLTAVESASSESAEV